MAVTSLPAAEAVACTRDAHEKLHTHTGPNRWVSLDACHPMCAGRVRTRPPPASWCLPAAKPRHGSWPTRCAPCCGVTTRSRVGAVTVQPFLGVSGQAISSICLQCSLVCIAACQPLRTHQTFPSCHSLGSAAAGGHRAHQGAALLQGQQDHAAAVHACRRTRAGPAGRQVGVQPAHSRAEGSWCSGAPCAQEGCGRFEQR